MADQHRKVSKKSGATATTETPVASAAGVVLIYASFWGRQWQTDATHKARATAIAQALSGLLASSGGGIFTQSSFFTNEGWYDGKISPEISPASVSRALQIVVNRGVAPEGDGRDDGSMAVVIVFLDETLFLGGGADDPKNSFHGHFETLLGNTSFYGVVPTATGAGKPGETGGTELAAAAGATLVAAICANPTPEAGWALAGSTNSVDGDTAASCSLSADRGLHPPASLDRLLPLPPIYMAERVPRFQMDDEELGQYLARLAAPLNFEEIPNSAAILRQATALIDAKVGERATRPRSATTVELRDFSRPNPRVTMAERMMALKFTIGENHRDVALVEQILEGVSDRAFARMRNAYFDDGAFKFVDAVYWIYWKLALVKRLGLDTADPLSIWDIGCGGGHFSRVCQHFGHRVLGTDMKHRVYGDIAAALNVERRIDILVAGKPTSDFGRKFDLVAAAQIEFDHLYPRTPPPRYWTLDHWKFLFNDLMKRQLNFPSRIYLTLNYRDDGAFDAPLMAFCADNGAVVNERRGTIDWKLDAPIEL